MKKQDYDKVGMLSVNLNVMLEELKACELEKKLILKWIDKLIKENKIAESQELIRERMSANLKSFEDVILEMEKINKKA